MRTLLPLTILLAAAVTGCGDATPFAVDLLAPGAGPLANSHASAAARPFMGTCETTFSPPPFPLPPTHFQIDVGTCQLGHLGRASMYGEQVIDFAAGTQAGERTITAANGDVLIVKNVGTSRPGEPGLIHFSATMTFVGGTGRFANATGVAQAEGTANLFTRTTTIDIVDGWIVYDASDRR